MAIAHYERYGQLNRDAAIIGATSAIANKVLFQITPRDADELAPEFAQKPPAETVRERELVVSQEPVRELLRGHRDADVPAFVDRYLRPLHEEKEDIRDDMEFERLILQDTREEAALHRIDAQTAEIYRENAAAERALQRAEASIYGVRRQIDKLISLFESGNGLRWLFRALNKFLAAVMQGEVRPGQEESGSF